MTTIDPEQERQRLTALYAAMSDEELKKVAAAAPELTEEAFQTLADEVQRRGLGLALRRTEEFDEVEGAEVVTVGRYRDVPEAQLAKGVLESAGIECFLPSTRPPAPACVCPGRTGMRAGSPRTQVCRNFLKLSHSVRNLFN